MDRPRLMRAVLVPVVALLLIACERDGTDPTADPPSPTRGSTTAPPIPAPPGSFRYQGLGVVAVLELDGRSGALEIRNDTGVELGEPRLYMFAADDGHRVELITRDPSPVPVGPVTSFEIRFDAAPAPVGMVFLRLGDDDFGAFVPVGAANA